MKRTLILLISLIFGTQFNVFYAQNSPSSIPGLFIWLAADNGVQTSGNEVTSWSNLTGSGNNFSSVNTSLRPKFVSSSNLNGLPYVNFDGTDNLTSAIAGTYGGTGVVNTKYCALSNLLSKFNDADDAATAAAPDPVVAPAADAVTFAIE
jgi:hypothetical protein